MVLGGAQHLSAYTNFEAHYKIRVMVFERTEAVDGTR